MFTQQVAEAGPIPIGTTDGTSLTLYPDWKDRCAAYVKLYCESIKTFHRTEHTKAVKFICKKQGTTVSAAALSVDSAAVPSQTLPDSDPISTPIKGKTNRRTNTRQPRNKSGAVKNIVSNS